MSNIKQLSGAIRFALFAGAATVLAAPAFAQDQQASEEEAKTLDRVEVTGSLIRSADIETTQPVQVITRAEIGARSVSSASPDRGAPAARWPMSPPWPSRASAVPNPDRGTA